MNFDTFLKTLWPWPALLIGGGLVTGNLGIIAITSFVGIVIWIENLRMHFAKSRAARKANRREGREPVAPPPQPAMTKIILAPFDRAITDYNEASKAADAWLDTYFNREKMEVMELHNLHQAAMMTAQGQDRQAIQSLMAHRANPPIDRAEELSLPNQFAARVIEARLSCMGKTLDQLSREEFAQFGRIRLFFLNTSCQRLLFGVPDPEEIIALGKELVTLEDARRERIRELSRAKAAHERKVREAGQVFHRETAEGAPDIRALPGPDIELWHELVVNTHDFHLWENTVRWILAQPECDRATVAEFLSSMVSYDVFLEEAARRGDAALLDLFRETVQRVEAGFYIYDTLGIDGGYTLTGRGDAERINAELARIRAETGAALPDVPAWLYENQRRFPKTMPDHWVDSGWRFEVTRGMMPKMQPARKSA